MSFAVFASFVVHSTGESIFRSFGRLKLQRGRGILFDFVLRLVRVGAGAKPTKVLLRVGAGAKPTKVLLIMVHLLGVNSPLLDRASDRGVQARTELLLGRDGRGVFRVRVGEL